MAEPSSVEVKEETTIPPNEENPRPSSTSSSESESETGGPIPDNLPELNPPESAVDITANKDGGVWKDIKREGTGEDLPLTGDSVSVHYVGTLTDGVKFDSSRDRDQYFEFKLGKGEVIKAWDLGVATMKRGELAVLYCRSAYAYGPSGSPPKIPPYASLIFEVELFDWKGEDLTTDKDGGILRSQLQAGDGFQSPSEGATVKVHIIGKHNDRVFDNREVSFTVGEGSEAKVIEGVDMAIQKFKKGERSLLKISSKYAYGSEGNEFDIPPNADLEYEVTLLEYEKSKESWEMDKEEKLEQAELMKQKGTGFFKQSKYKLAERYYKKIIDFVEHEKSYEDEAKQKREALILAGHLNLAMCYLKMGDDIGARSQCDQALEIDPKSEKALFRRGTAHMNVKDFEEALTDFKQVLELDANNKAAKNQVTLANQKIKQMKDKEKKIYGGMFQKFAELDAKREASKPKELVQNGDAQNGEAHDSDSSGEEMETDSAPEGEEESVPSEGEKVETVPTDTGDAPSADAPTQEGVVA